MRVRNLRINMKTFAIKSFGCKVNQYEEQLLRENLINVGFRETTFDNADVFILNSCTVTNNADKKALRFIKKVKRLNSKVKTIFTGCIKCSLYKLQMLLIYTYLGN